MAIIFDGYATAAQKEITLQQQVSALMDVGLKPTIASILFTEDSGSQLYTRYKKEAAARVGIDYEVSEFSLTTPVEVVKQRILELDLESHVNGIIVQKPWRKTWLAVNQGQAADFQTWWSSLVSSIALHKDVDGLHPDTLKSIQAGSWQAEKKVLPATCAAVLEIIDSAIAQLQLSPANLKTVVLGKSDLLGQPLFAVLQNRGWVVEMMGSAELAARVEQGMGLTDADIVVSATGQPNLITGLLIKPGAIVIDVGEPQPDVDFASVEPKAGFLTPVPGGVGPMTVVYLLANCITLVTNNANKLSQPAN